MRSFIFWALLIAGCVLGILSRRLPAHYRTRGCTGRHWRRRFPKAAAPAIRRFLRTFTDAFGFPVRHGLKFSPDDKLMEVYRAKVPHRGVTDELELETLDYDLRREYGVSLGPEDRDITLGEIYARVRS